MALDVPHDRSRVRVVSGDAQLAGRHALELEREHAAAPDRDLGAFEERVAEWAGDEDDAEDEAAASRRLCRSHVDLRISERSRPTAIVPVQRARHDARRPEEVARDALGYERV